MGFGSMPNDDYPYEQVVGACRFDSTKVTARATNILQFSGEQDNEVLMDAIDQSPLYVGINASD
jgi:hypothetical protein